MPVSNKSFSSNSSSAHARNPARINDFPTQITSPNNPLESSDEESGDQNFVPTQDLTQHGQASPQLGEKPSDTTPALDAAREPASTPPPGQRVVLPVSELLCTHGAQSLVANEGGCNDAMSAGTSDQQFYEHGWRLTSPEAERWANSIRDRAIQDEKQWKKRKEMYVRQAADHRKARGMLGAPLSTSTH
jgi:hypothetical protein